MFKTCLARVVAFALSFSVSLPALADLQPANSWPLTVNGAELFNRNEVIGEPYELNLKFTQWIDVDEGLEEVRSTLGLSPGGRLFQLVEYLNPEGPRRVARLLSGERKIVKFYKTETSHIVAIDDQNQIIVFDGKRWAESPVKKYLRQGAAIWAISTLAMIAGSLSFNFDLIMQHPITYAAYTSVLSAGVALNAALVKLMQFSESNQVPDGFRDTGIPFTNEADLEVTWQNIKKARNLQDSAAGWHPVCQSQFLEPLPRNLRTSINE